jgi:hypothetical protein
MSGKNELFLSFFSVLVFSGARVSSIFSISSISSRGDGLNPNLLYPPLEEDRGDLGWASSISSILTRSYLINSVNFTFAETRHIFQLEFFCP